MKNPGSKSTSHDLRYRTLVNGLSAILIAAFIFFSSFPALRWIFVLAAAAIAGTALWEFYELAKKKQIMPAIILGIISAVVYVFVVFFKTQSTYFWRNSLWQNAPAITLSLIFFACFVYFAFVKKPPITHISTTFFGVVYIGVPLGLLVQVMYFFVSLGNSDLYHEGSWWVIYLIAVTKCTDIAGYFIGRCFGKRKLALTLSPNKTLEGAIGGLIASILVSLLLCFLGKSFGHVFIRFSYISSIWLGALIGIFGQIGDLAESLLKRDANVKDSNTIPGVGGVLDMIDSLLFSTPIVYLFLRIFYT